ncbi:DUF4350 domain-containing protein [Halostella sp. JP-L12]|uniref:DUF4350 domain-containing protein n=1 Tax=Halostella TaxID=1843185 RepID=UPI000EF7F409|nr:MULTISPECIES: DUF4350 domain-containing protein [Halostella]NHN46433.1 DUF4350 domain-containing protein [Halostella sp. JP-L12]
MRSPFDLDYPQLLLAALVVITLLAGGVAASTSTAGFGAYNPQWDGAADLREVAVTEGADSRVVTDTAEYDATAPNGSVAVVLSPDESYDPDEAARIRTFVENGGTVVVADDFGGNGNALLADLGADARINGDPLRDERHYYRSPNFPVANNVSNHTLTADVGALTLNHGSAVAPNGATVLVRTSEFAYVDANRNEEIDDNETLASSPVATSESVGEGRVVVVGDPSLFINAMLDRAGNRAFVGNLFGSADTVMLDYSHSEQVPPLIGVLIAIQRSAVLQIVLGTAGVLGIALWARWPTVDSVLPTLDDSEVSTDSPFLTADDIAAAVRERHPEWDDKRVQHVTEGIMSRRFHSQNDD